MTILVTTICDICGRKIRKGETESSDLGVWFLNGQIGIPHICGACEETTTIAEARARLKLKPAPGPVYVETATVYLPDEEA